MWISRSEKPINRSGMTPEQRNHMLGAIWSSSLSEGNVRHEKRCGKWWVSCKKTRWNVPDHSEKYICWRQKKSSGSFSLGRKILYYIDAELNNQVIGMQLATEIELYPEISFITRYWNIKLRLYHKNPEFYQKNLETIPKNLEVSFASRSFSIVLQVLHTFIYPNVHILSDVLLEPTPTPPPNIFFIGEVESWVLVGLEVDDETSPASVVPCRMTGIRPWICPGIQDIHGHREQTTRMVKHFFNFFPWQFVMKNKFSTIKIAHWSFIIENEKLEKNIP
jgi:hypothetical protein